MSVKEPEILEIRKALETSVDKGTHTVTVELLEQLLTIKATEDILRSTRIGVFVNDVKKKATQSNHAKVIEKAKQVVDKWKQDVSRAKTSTTTSSSSSSATTTDLKGRKLSVDVKSSNITNNTDSNNGSGPPTPTPHIGERSSATDNVKLKSLKDQIRQKCLEMLYNALVTDTTVDSDVVAKKAAALEEEVWNQYQGSTNKEVYKARIRTLYSNLKNKSNFALRENVLNGSVKPDALASMSVADMASEERKAEEERYNKEAMHWAVAAADTRATTDQLPCGKCRQRKTSYFQKQTRSADEPMTTFCECLNCGHHWKG
ncbi:hypothetical protein SmJEL517_g02287 [Synchytrium microbalum]|uniref:Transcription elongation factor n=1 Tax=Synchytrium microbalum TaxID=1806994 RepID=A0A507C2H5_9FUNG|nr:uncharacterized protein SmJEL517_g02287 [Synchytrium microbalum]TPX35327.1 hypothetical protein SmJEL517_g02287 [Synchytrium microbalum]